MNQVLPLTRLSEPRGPIADPRFDPVAAAHCVAESARKRACALDDDTSFPSEDVRALAEAGLLAAPLPRHLGGMGLGLDHDANLPLARVLTIIGGASLPLGRLYEGHVNALKLIGAFGRPEQLARTAHLVRRGDLLGVWNTEANDGVRLVGRGQTRRLEGRKVFCSGAGHIAHPLITACDDTGQRLMVLPTIDESARADLSGWSPHGMRASASGAVDFSGIAIKADDVVGGPDDFHKQPLFATGAWRFATVQTGGIGAVFDAARAHLVAAGRADAPLQRARLGRAAIAVQTARQWVVEAAKFADDDRIDAASRIAHVNLARSAVERAGLDVLELAHRSVGLAGFQRSHPLERLTRDLATYLRQPDPDGALDDAAAFMASLQRPVLDTWPWS